MDFGLSQEQQRVVDTVRSFVEQEPYPLERELGRAAMGLMDDLPRELLRPLGG